MIFRHPSIYYLYMDDTQQLSAKKKIYHTQKRKQGLKKNQCFAADVELLDNDTFRSIQWEIIGKSTDKEITRVTHLEYFR